MMANLDSRVHDLEGVEWFSGVSGTREGYPPFVTMRVTSSDGHTIAGQMDTKQALEIAWFGMQTAEAADMDSAVMRFLCDNKDFNEETAGMFVATLRSYRESMK